MRKVLIIATLFSLFFGVHERYSAQSNLSSFDDKFFHFGFALSYNKSDYYLSKSLTFNPIDDSLQSLLVKPMPGFTLGVITSINFNPNFKLRFAIPSLSFQERNIEYRYLDPSNDESITIVKSLRPVYLDFPILLKFRTDRIDNWAVYGITGMRFGLDMASDKDVNNLGAPIDEQIIKLTKADFGMEVGGGFDFFLQYFKLGVELKLGVGMVNIHINEGTQFDDPIGSLKSKVWTFSLTFEG